MKKICVYAICKNESKFIDRWINSLKEADKIVVLDTGSTDNTVELLKKYEPLVEVHQKIIDPWRFDTARNESMKYIPEDADICVVSDCDQVFRPGWSDVLRRNFEAGYQEVWGPIIDYDDNNVEVKRFLSRNVHPNSKDWYWERPVHESLDYHGDGDFIYTVDNDFVIEHHPDRTKSRGQYLEILKREYEENKHDPMCVIYYGCELSFHGKDEESLQVFLDGINDPECDLFKDPAIGYQIYLNTALGYKDKGELEIALKYSYGARKFKVYTRRLYMNTAYILKDLKRYREAIIEANSALAITQDIGSWIESREYFQGECERFINECKSLLPKVCVYAICKNEINHVDRWLNSVKDADKIIVVDTGSTDGTYEKLSNIKAEDDKFSNLYVDIIDINPWRFDKARNHALNTARKVVKEEKIDKNSDVIYVSLDFDEFLEDGGIYKIKENWNEGIDTLAINGITVGAGTQSVTHKIHSSDKRWHWVRSVHEIICRKDKKESDWVTRFPENPIYYTHEQDLSKKRDYYELLKIENNEDPNNIKTLTYLAWEASLHNEIDKSVEYAIQAEKLILTDQESEFYLNYEYLIQEYIYEMQSNDEIFVENAINNALKIINEGKFPDFRRIHDLSAKWFFEKKKKKKAVEQYKQELEIKERPYCWIDNDENYNNGKLYNDLALAEYYNGNYAEALSYGDLAILEDSENQLYRSNREYYYQKYRDSFREFANKPFGGTNKICVYAICKNEDQFVDKWVESMKEADSVVVLDTGSTDNTVEHLRSLGVTVEVKEIKPWRFDIARNEALRLVPDDCNILISTDLDELLEPGWSNILREKWVDGEHVRGIYKYTWSHLANGEEGRVFHYDKIHNRNWIWKYPVHELLADLDNDSENYNNSLYLFDDIHLHHYPDQTKSRGSYLPLLELRAEVNKNDWYGLIYLSHEYYYRGFYQKSIDKLQYILDNYSDHYSDVEKASCYLFMADDYAELHNWSKSIDNYINAINVDPTYREPYIGLAHILLDQKQYLLAETYLKMALDKTYRHYTWLERDTSWTYELFDLLCLATYYAGKKRDSILYAIKALSFSPEDERLKNNLKLCLENTEDKELI